VILCYHFLHIFVEILPLRTDSSRLDKAGLSRLTQKQRRATLAKAAEARQQEKHSDGNLRQKQNFCHLLSTFKNKYTDLTPFHIPVI